MADEFRLFSESVVTSIQRAERFVVRVEGRRRIPASGLVWSGDGLVVTAHHVLERDDNLLVGLGEAQSISASLVGRDPSTDLAVLRIQNASNEAFPRASIDSLHVGQFALALGKPGHHIQASLGMINILGDAWRTPTGGNISRYIRTGVEMLPGFSGGPLVNASGELIGLNSSALLREHAATIPTDTIQRVVEALVTHGRIRRGYLGIGTQPVRLPEALGEELEQETGLLVVSVETGSPAEQSGLLLGDILVRFENDPIRFPDDLVANLGGDRVGSPVEIELIRGGQRTKLGVTLGERK